MKENCYNFFVRSRLTVIFFVIVFLVLLLEIAKEIFLPDVRAIWVSHTITILFSASFATLITFIVRNIAREAQQQASLLLESVSEGIYGVDIKGRCTFVNPAFLRILGYQNAGELIGKHMHTLIHHSSADGSPYPATECRMYRAYQRNEETHVDDEVFWRRDGTAVQVEYWSHPVLHNGILIGAVANFMDITERKQVESELRNSEQRFRDVSDSAGEYLWEIDANMVYTYASSRSVDVKGYTPEELVGHTPMEFMHAEDIDRVGEIVNHAIANKTPFRLEHRDICKSGEVRWEEVNGLPIYDTKGAVVGLRGAGLNINTRKQMEEQVRQLAFYDTLTSLPNRRLLDERLKQVMVASKRKNCYGAVIFLDLDNFKSLNDTYGHTVGDLLLIEAANRLKNCVRAMDAVARFGGDEFVVILSDLDENKLKSTKQAHIVAEKILAALSAPYLLTVRQQKKADASVEHHCTASIGVVVFINHEHTPIDILKWADKAMYQAKESGRNQIRFFDSIA